MVQTCKDAEGRGTTAEGPDRTKANQAAQPHHPRILEGVLLAATDDAAHTCGVWVCREGERKERGRSARVLTPVFLCVLIVPSGFEVNLTLT